MMHGLFRSKSSWSMPVKEFAFEPAFPMHVMFISDVLYLEQLRPHEVLVSEGLVHTYDPETMGAGAHSSIATRLHMAGLSSRAVCSRPLD